jgi:hypothetical protein
MLLIHPTGGSEAPGCSGVPYGMSKLPEEDAVGTRAHLLPEEVAAGSDDPGAQAEAILEESQDRTLHPEATGHESSQTHDGGRS